jgi:HTH-type transcriptional regulator, sugar sensing transcriptional regulator
VCHQRYHNYQGGHYIDEGQIMDVVALLQEAGFNKYEAEAYVALARHGALTGYEVGKRSQVPLSRSYEILERLAEKGWVQVQPGEPPRYLAVPPGEMLTRLRAGFAAQIADLTVALGELESRPQPPGYWVLAGREAILAHLRALVAEAQSSLTLALPPAAQAELAEDFAVAGQRLQITYAPIPVADAIIVRADERIALVGSLAPSTTCKAILTTEPALVMALQAHFTMPQSIIASVPTPASNSADWLAWEARKQQSLQHGR